jgi:hypothetical protein
MYTSCFLHVFRFSYLFSLVFFSLTIFLFFASSVFSRDVKRTVFVFLLLICLVWTGTGKLSWKCLLGEWRSRNRRFMDKYRGPRHIKALSVEELDFDICSSVWFRNRENTYSEIEFCEKIPVTSKPAVTVVFSFQKLARLKSSVLNLRFTTNPSPYCNVIWATWKATYPEAGGNHLYGSEHKAWLGHIIFLSKFSCF